MDTEWITFPPIVSSSRFENKKKEQPWSSIYQSTIASLKKQIDADLSEITNVK